MSQAAYRHAVLLLLNCTITLLAVEGANWAQLAGERAQNTATPYIPDLWHRDRGTSLRPMWSARWGHAVVVLNQTVARSYLSAEENSARARDSNPVLVLLGGDDGVPRSAAANNFTTGHEMGTGSGKLRNDVWIGELTSGLQASWRVDDRYFVSGSGFSADLIRSEMKWYMSTPGRVSPATWPSGRKYSLPMTQEDWIACQDSIQHNLFDPTICNEPPIYCHRDIQLPGCEAQAVWKKDNMWSPRRGHGAAVANGKIFVIGGQAREYARIEDTRIIGGIDGGKRIKTVREHSTIREDLVLKNDIWISEDGRGASWKLVNPGCKDHQEDVLVNTEMWSSGLSTRKNVGSFGSRCFHSSDCYGVAECKSLGNTRERVCVCPILSPRENAAVAIQHRFSTLEDSSIFAEDVIYVVGGFTSVKQAFCSDWSCGPADGYRLALDDAWMSVDGVKWLQFKPATSDETSFKGRGSHTALVIHSYFQGNSTESNMTDRLFIFGGETADPHELTTTYLNDIWQLNLPTEPCCALSEVCSSITSKTPVSCITQLSDWKVVTSESEWPKRSGHVTIYEPPSSRNSFQHRIYLTNGKNGTSMLSDVWTLFLDRDDEWKCDFCPEHLDERSNYDQFLNANSSLSMLSRFILPSLESDGKIDNFTSHSVFPIVSESDIRIMASLGVKTINDLATADLYTILKLRGFDFPGRKVVEIPNICFLRAASIDFVEKCKPKYSAKSFFHTMKVTRIGQPTSRTLPKVCGRGGDSKPCTVGDWDGCSPIVGVTSVDVHGLGDVEVPQSTKDTLGVIEEVFCSQTPAGRYSGAAAFIENKMVVLGGIGNSQLYRDVWTRDESFPKAAITVKPESQTSQFTFQFDSNEAGAHVFEYKIILNGVDVIPWTITTKSLGVDVSWLDDKKGGPGEGWYTLYVRAIDPSGNRDSKFSTKANVYHWYYVPPIPWGVVAGCIVSFLALILGGYVEYRRRKRKAALQRFALRRLRRKFKLKAVNPAVNEEKLFQEFIPSVVRTESTLHQRRGGEILDQFSNSRKSSSHGRNRSRSRHGKARRRENNRTEHQEYMRRPHSRSRSKSRSSHLTEVRQRRKKKKTGEDELRNRNRRDREKNRRQNLREY